MLNFRTPGVACDCIPRGLWSPLHIELREAENGLLPLDTGQRSALIEICFTCFMGISQGKCEKFAFEAFREQNRICEPWSVFVSGALLGPRCPNSCRLPGWFQHTHTALASPFLGLLTSLLMFNSHAHFQLPFHLSPIHSQNSGFLFLKKVLKEKEKRNPKLKFLQKGTP